MLLNGLRPEVNLLTAKQLLGVDDIHDADSELGLRSRLEYTTALYWALTRAREALRVYGGHVPTCGVFLGYRDPSCTCGFSKEWQEIVE